MMKTAGMVAWFVCLAPFLLSPGGARAAEVGDGPIAAPEPGWPQWRGPRRDGISEEKGLLPSWPEGGPKLLWKIDGLGGGWSSPVIVSNRLYIPGDLKGELVIHAFDLEGKPVWRGKNGQAWSGAYPGARACCVFSAGRLYQMNAHGRVVCLDAVTGQEIWGDNVLERFAGRNITWAIAECLLVDGARLIVTPGGKKGLMVALDKTNGKTLWTTEPLENDATSYSSPLLFRHGGRRLITSCSSSHGFGVDADTGKLLWTVPLRNPYDVNVSIPIYGQGMVYYVCAHGSDGNCYRLLKTAQGMQAEHAWKSSVDTVTGSGILVGDTLFASGYERYKSWLAIDWRSGATKY